jgi:phosphoribosylanthranilate isomerase
MTPRVKVCGITRVEDAMLAADLGAAAIGFVFWPKSPRVISVETARAIAATVPPWVVCVGVFVDQDAEYVRETARDVPLGAIQLHGNEPPAYAATLMQPVLKALPVHAGFDARALDELPPAITVLLDAHDPERRGGTGATIDWQIAKAAAMRRPIVLSGGLNPDNVAAAIDTVHPYAVDVSSGVELAPGVKDPDKMRAFFRAVGAVHA